MERSFHKNPACPHKNSESRKKRKKRLYTVFFVVVNFCNFFGISLFFSPNLLDNCNIFVVLLSTWKAVKRARYAFFSADDPCSFHYGVRGDWRTDAAAQHKFKEVLL